MDINNRIKVFITGGTGTLGKAILRRAKTENWSWEFAVFSRDYVKQARLKSQYPNVNFIIGDIRDYDRLQTAVSGHDLIIHAAAMKHVSASMENVTETVSVNVDGTKNVALAAIQNGVGKVVMPSTDKVCYPNSVYGMTKSLAEHIFLEYDRFGLTEFHMCRYGNVIGSTGSVGS